MCDTVVPHSSQSHPLRSLSRNSNSVSFYEDGWGLGLILQMPDKGVASAGRLTRPQQR